MFNIPRLKKLLPIGIYAVVYTVLFILFVKFFWYITPFAVGLAIACIARRPIRFFINKFGMKNNVASAIITGFIVLLIFAVLISLCVFLFHEISSLFSWATGDNFANLLEVLGEISEKVNNILGKNFIENNMDKITEYLISGAGIVTSAIALLIGTVSSVPTVLTWLTVAVFSAFVFSRHMHSLRRFICGLLSEKAVSHLQFAIKSTGSSSKKSFVSYTFLYLIAFCESLVITSILGLEYPFVISLVMCFADVLPVLGPGMVYVPLMLFHLILGNFSIAAGLGIGLIIITITREIVEPKLISDSMQIHPLAMISGVYFSLAAQNFWIMFYTIGLFTFYTVLKESGALPPLLVKRKQKTKRKPAK